MSCCRFFALLFFLSLSFSFSLAGAPEKGEKKKETPPAVRLPVPDSGSRLAKEDPSYRDLAFFLRSLALIRKAYVDEKKVTQEELLKKALRGLLRELDPYSAYESPEEAKENRQRTSGSFAGIGVTVRGREGAVEVLAVFEGGPAEKAGVRSGDLIAEVNGEAVSGNDLEDCVRKIKGEVGTSLTLKIFRRNTPQPLMLTMRRSVVKMSSIVNVFPLEPGIGYLRISSFSMNTAEELLQALKKFPEGKYHSLIIDLRNNPGGLLDAAIACCSIFLPSGKEVVSTAGRLPSSRRTYPARDLPKRMDLALAILINGGSASAAEIMAGCLRDHNRAVLAGTKSFGKGSVQSVLPLGRTQGAMRLTTARYFTPSRKMIHGKGIMPDINAPITPVLQMKLSSGHLSRSFQKKAAFDSFIREDPQLARARELLRSLQILAKKKK